MRKRHEKDILAEAIEQLRKQGRANPLPQEVLDETATSNCGMRNAECGIGHSLLPHSALDIGLKFAAAAAVFLLVGYVAGRLAAPDVDQLREALTPSIAASLEPVLRQKLGEEMKDRVSTGAGRHVSPAERRTYAAVPRRFEPLCHADAGRFQRDHQRTPGRSASDHRHRPSQDQRRIALALAQIEAKRMQDKTQLAAGLQTLAYRTEDEFARTKKVLARFLIDEPPREIELPRHSTPDSPNERIEE